jgi:hypothetical protein
LERIFFGDSIQEKTLKCFFIWKELDKYILITIEIKTTDINTFFKQQVNSKTILFIIKPFTKYIILTNSAMSLLKLTQKTFLMLFQSIIMRVFTCLDQT